MSFGKFIARGVQAGLMAASLLAVSSLGFAQTSGFSESNIPPSGVVQSPYAKTGRAASAADTPEAASSPGSSSSTAGENVPKPPPKPKNTFPYTIRPGDSMGSIAQMFGITPEDLAHMNHIHPDEELMAGDELKVPNPFVAQLKTLEAQVNLLSNQARTAQEKEDSAERDLTSLKDKVQDLTTDNQSLNSSLRTLPWWHATALMTTVVSILMFGVMVVTLFEWWRMRRRYVELAGLADDLGRLDYKYKAMLAKAELRLQQLYGRRRGGITEGQPRPKLPEEVEIERLNEELKEVLERHLARLGVRP